MKKATWVVLPVGMLLLLALAGCGGKADAEATVAALVSITGSPADASPGGLGKWVEDSGLAMVVHAVEDPAVPDTRRYQPKPGTRLVAVEWELGCLTGTHHGAPHEARLIDDRGVRHEVVFGAMADHPEFRSVPLAMSERVRGWLAFELSDGATPSILEYRPTLWGDTIMLQASLVE